MNKDRSIDSFIQVGLVGFGLRLMWIEKCHTLVQKQFKKLLLFLPGIHTVAVICVNTLIENFFVSNLPTVPAVKDQLNRDNTEVNSPTTADLTPS